MTSIAENQLDFHRSTYYPICVSISLKSKISHIIMNFFILAGKLRQYYGVLQGPTPDKRGDRRVCHGAPKSDGHAAEQTGGLAHDPLQMA